MTWTTSKKNLPEGIYVPKYLENIVQLRRLHIALNIENYRHFLKDLKFGQEIKLRIIEVLLRPT